MTITTITTRPITTSDKSLAAILDQYVTSFSEESILVITSKIVSLTEDRVMTKDKATIDALVAKEADRYLKAETSKHAISITIKNNLLVPNAGIDESNGNGHYILWPKDAQKTANASWTYLKKRFSLKQCGIIITDSITTPLRWGTIGTALAHCGFAALNDYRGKPDIFGKKLAVTQSNIANGLAAAAVLVMGEGSEQTPLALITDVPNVVFQDHHPTLKELKALHIDIKDDLFAPLLKSVKWYKGKK